MKPSAFHISKILAALALSLPLISGAHAETYTYDSVGRLIGVVYDDGSSTTFSYDTNGNLLQSVSSPVVSSSTNEAPSVSIIGGNQLIADTDGAAGETVSLSATATDSDGTVATTEWLIDNAVKAVGLTLNISLTGGNTAVIFRATDNDGASSTDAVTITVIEPSSLLPVRTTLASDGSSTNAVISGGVSSDNGDNFKSDFLIGDVVKILVVLEPESEDIGFNSDIFVVAAIGTNFLLLTPDGLIPWDGNAGNLIAFSKIELSARNEFNVLDLFGGQFTLSAGELGSFRFFIGYTSRDGKIIYTEEAIELNVSE